MLAVDKAPHPTSHFEADFKDYGIMGTKETLDSRSWTRFSKTKLPSQEGRGSSGLTLYLVRKVAQILKQP